MKERSAAGLLAALSLGTLSGIGFALTLIGFDLAWLAWVTLAPWTVMILTRPAPAALAGGALGWFAAGLIQWGCVPALTLRMTGSCRPGALLMAGVCLAGACWMALLSGLLYRFRGAPADAKTGGRRALMLLALIPSAWVAFDWGYDAAMSRAAGIFFPFAGYSQWNWPPVVAVASLAGVHGVTFLIVLFNTALALLVVCRRYAPLAVAGAVIAGAMAWGHCGSAGLHGDPVTVALLQPNIAPFDKYDRARSDDLARRCLALAEEANRARANLVVWPETAIPWVLRDGDDLVEQALKRTREAGSCHIIGGVAETGGAAPRYYNSAFMVLADGRVVGRYNKLRLLPFVETPLPVPGSPRWRLQLPDEPPAAPGERQDLLESPFGKIGVVICNEVFYSELTRRAAQNGASLIASLANGGWFEPREMRRHFQITFFRAAECGRPIVAANNSGISGVIDARGKVLIQSQPGTFTAVTATAVCETRRTLFVRGGCRFPLVCGAAAALICAGLVRSRANVSST